MTLTKPQKKFIVLAILSMLLGYLIVTTTQTQIETWGEIISESNPAFTIWMPNGAHHSTAEVTNEKFGKSFKTASIISEENDIQYVLNITDYTEESDLAIADLFHNTLDLFTAAQGALLVAYDDAGNTVNFVTMSKDGLYESTGRMVFTNGYIFLQFVSCTAENFDEEKYEKFTTSLAF